MYSGGNNPAMGARLWQTILSGRGGLQTALTGDVAEVKQLEGADILVEEYGIGPAGGKTDLVALSRVAEGVARMDSATFEDYQRRVAARLSTRSATFAEQGEVTARLRVLLSQLERDRILRLARGSAVVQNGLLLPEHVAYQMAWKQRINPDSKPISVIYGGMGPDVSTVLLATDASVVYGIDFAEISLKHLQKWLGKWRTLKHGGTRQTSGYWPQLFPWEHEELARRLQIELKTMGVDPSTIQISSNPEGHVVIEFDWAYPNAELRRRKIVYMRGDLADFIQWPVADVYYQKSVPFPLTKKFLMRLLPSITGWMIFGSPFLAIQNNDQQKALIQSTLGAEFELIELNFFDAFLGPVLGGDYGWRLYGARRKR